MLYSFRLYNRDPWVWLPFVGSILLEAFIIGYAFVKLGPTEDQIFLHNTIIFGVDLTVDGREWWKIFIFPALGVLFTVGNYLFSWMVYSRDRLLARLQAVGTMLFALALFAGMMLIISLNS